MPDFRNPTFVERITAAWFAAEDFCDRRVLFTAPDAEESAAWARRAKRYGAQANLVYDLEHAEQTAEEKTAVTA